jgi:hypothetical protein
VLARGDERPAPPAAEPGSVARRLPPFYWTYRGIVARISGLSRGWRWVPGWAFAAVTLAPALLAMAWLAPATGMLLAGRLLPLPMVIIFVPLAVALCYFGTRQLPLGWSRFGDSDDSAEVPGVVVVGSATGESGGNPETRATGESAAIRRRPEVPLAALLATVAIAAGFGVWQAALRSEQLFGTGDPSVYLQYGYWIAGHGTVRIPTSVAAFGGAGGLNFASPGYTVAGGSITPSFLPGLPMVLAAGTWLGGLGGALLMPAVLGGCAVLAFGGLVGRLCGARWAPAGALVLAVGMPEVYTSRTPFAEPLVQVLLFGGLSMVIDSLAVRRRASGGLALAGLGGLALGLTVLVQIESLGLLLPAFPVLALLFVQRQPQAGPFGFGLFLGIGTGLAAGLVLARAYMSTISADLHLIGLAAAGFGVVTALVAPLALPGVRSWARRTLTARPRFLGLGGEEAALPSLASVVQWAALLLPVFVLVGLAIRPYLQTVHGQASPAVVQVVASLQRLEGLPVDGTRQYYESTLDWVLWYLGVPGVLLACAGASILGWRSTRGVLERPASVAAAWLWGLPYLLIVWTVVSVLWDPDVAPWQPLASHRLVPLVLPGLVLLGVWVSSRLVARARTLGASGAAVVLVGFCCVLALTIPPVVTTLNPVLRPAVAVGQASSGVSKLISRVQLRGVGGSATYGGSLAATASLCAAIGPSASVLFVDPATAATFAPVVREICGQPAATVPGSSSSALESAATQIERVGRHPILLGASKSSVSLFGVVPRRVVSLRTTGDARVLTGAPAGNWPVSYTAWMTSPLGSGTGAGATG